MDNNLFKNVDFTTKTTYTELQLLYASGTISKHLFAEKVIYFWNKTHATDQELCQDYLKFKYCFDLFMDTVIEIEGKKRTQLVCLYTIKKL